MEPAGAHSRRVAASGLPPQLMLDETITAVCS